MESKTVPDESSAQGSIIEGLVKFRDGKKWKSRWCVMRKLSPVADCVHLQLYKDGKERRRGGQPKASLALRELLALEAGFPLERECDTLALVCRALTAVLALPGPEALLLWRVRAERALLLVSAPAFPAVLAAPSPPSPPRARVPAGPVRVRVHVSAARLALVAGSPPKLLAVWDIAHLRRYGVVDGRFCLEGGARCGRLGGAWAFILDHPQRLAEAVRAAAPADPNANEDAKSISNLQNQTTDSNASRKDIFDIKNWNRDTSYQESEAGSSIGFGDSVSVTDVSVNNAFDRDHRGSNRHHTIGRCVSCMSRIGGPVITPGANPPATWSIDSVLEKGSESDRTSMYSQSSGSASEYSVPRGICTSGPNVPPKNLCPCSCRELQRSFTGPYDNYDVPRSHMPLIPENPVTPAMRSSESHYDKPKNLKKCLVKNTVNCNCSIISKGILTVPIDDFNKVNKSLLENENNNQSDSMETSVLSNYVNIEPLFKKEVPLQNIDSETIDLASLSETLEKFESSAEILRRAGFSQEELDDLDNMPLVINKPIVCNSLAIENQNYLEMQPLDVALLPLSDDATSFSGSQTIIHQPEKCELNSCLSRRKSSSAEFLKKAENFCEILKSNSQNNLYPVLNPLRKNMKNECVNDNCINCIKELHEIHSDKKQQEATKLPDNKVLTKFQNLKDSVKIRRSSSVPSKTEKKRDSSSSNDSGVSTGSFKHYKCECSKFEVPKVTSRHYLKNPSSKMNRKTMDYAPISIMSSMSDPMQQISFQFDKVNTLTKASSCDAGSTNCNRRNTHGSASLDGRTIRSPSSCGSEISDLETSSLSSMSSGDTVSRSTARPRSGQEYSVHCNLRIPSCQCCLSTQVV